jgi:hypothetical protein
MIVLFHTTVLGFERGDVVEFSGLPEAMIELQLLVASGYLEVVEWLS